MNKKMQGKIKGEMERLVGIECHFFFQRVFKSVQEGYRYSQKANDLCSFIENVYKFVMLNICKKYKLKYDEASILMSQIVNKVRKQNENFTCVKKKIGKDMYSIVGKLDPEYLEAQIKEKIEKDKYEK